MPFSNYFTSQAINHLLRGVEVEPSSCFMTFTVDEPNLDGTNLDEVELVGVDRQPVTFGNVEDNYVEATTDVQFTGLPDGVVTHVVLVDAEVGGNLLVVNTYNATFSAGQSLFISAADINLLSD